MDIIQIDTLRILSTGGNIGLADPLKVLLYHKSFGELNASTNNVSAIWIQLFGDKLAIAAEEKIGPFCYKCLLWKEKEGPCFHVCST